MVHDPKTDQNNALPWCIASSRSPYVVVTEGVPSCLDWVTDGILLLLSIVVLKVWWYHMLFDISLANGWTSSFWRSTNFEGRGDSIMICSSRFVKLFHHFGSMPEPLKWTPPFMTYVCMDYIGNIIDVSVTQDCIRSTFAESSFTYTHVPAFLDFRFFSTKRNNKQQHIRYLMSTKIQSAKGPTTTTHQ